MKVLSVYDGFFVGGSRIVHSSIIGGLNQREGQEHQVLSLTNRINREGGLQFIHDTPSYAYLVERGVDVHSLNRSPEDDLTSTDYQIAQELIDWADIILVLKEQPLPTLDKLKVNKPVIVSVHRSDPINQGPGLLDAVNSGFVTQLVSCGYSIKNIYEEYGVPRDKIHVVENGIDIDRFVPDDQVRVEKRIELGIPVDSPVIIQAARFDKMKNIPLFVEAAAKYMTKEPNAHIIMCGAGMTNSNEPFAELTKNLPQDRLHALGIVKNMETVYPAADIVALSSSFGEAAPLCILEGLACNTIPVVTNIGDSALLVADCGLITPDDSSVMVRQWEHVLNHRFEFISRIERERLSEERMIDSYENLLMELITK